MALPIPAKTALPFLKCRGVRGIFRHFWRAVAAQFCYKRPRLREDIPMFVAHASHPSLGEQTADGRIGFDRWHMHFESEYGAFQIPISQLQIHKANGKEEPVYFSDPG